MLAAAEWGNVKAIDVVSSAAEALGGCIGWLVNVLDPELVIFWGGPGLNEGLYRRHLVGAACRHICWKGHNDIPFISARTGSDASHIGPAATCWTRLGEETNPRFIS